MKNKLVLIIISFVIGSAFVSGTIRKSSSGAPASHTGAPGEKTCGAAGCHDDNALNSGTATLNLQLGNNETAFVPGKTYPIKIKITDAGVTRFGFQLVALESKSLTDLGTFQLTDSARTQFVSNAYTLKDRKYITYTFDGTDASGEGYAEWSVNWTAPVHTKKPVTFYLAAVSGNDNMTDKGDKVYTANYTFKQSGHKQ